ncbi:MAG: CPBP family intramembrane glutamic endopeptidase [Prolixibacteraceae bacterium]|jgi:membrane protease YdiL (CAAX protease family)
MIDYQAIDFSWRKNDLSIFLPVILTLISFVIYWFTTQSARLKLRFYNRFDADHASAYHITFNRVVGFVVLGVIPVVISLIFLPEFSLANYGLTIRTETSLFSAVWIIGLAFVIVPLAYFSAKKPKNLLNYPQIRSKIWTKNLVLINAFGWALYLLGYELLFRGVLLIPLAGQLGVWPAVAVNISLYSATHIPKGLGETIGAIPFGLVLCILTLASGTIWIAFFAHLIMALTSSFASLKFNPEMKYLKSKTD